MRRDGTGDENTFRRLYPFSLHSQQGHRVVPHVTPRVSGALTGAGAPGLRHKWPPSSPFWPPIAPRTLPCLRSTQLQTTIHFYLPLSADTDARTHLSRPQCDVWSTPFGSSTCCIDAYRRTAIQPNVFTLQTSYLSSPGRRCPLSLYILLGPPRWPDIPMSGVATAHKSLPFHSIRALMSYLVVYLLLGCWSSHICQ